MRFEWPTAAQMIYRIVRLRRLLVVAAVGPVLALGVALLMDPAVLSGQAALLWAVVVAVLLVSHVVMFPNVPLETLSVSLALTTLVLLVPQIRALSGLLPPQYTDAALALFAALAVFIAGAMMLISRILFAMLLLVGPAVRLRLRAVIAVPCTPDVARTQFSLHPSALRGRVLTGEAGDDGFFDVAVVAPHLSDPEFPAQPMVVRVAAKSLVADPDAHETMLVSQTGAVTVTTESFTPSPKGCRVEVTEMPGDFTAAMHALFWLTDQQRDNLIEIADRIAGTPPRTNGVAHGVSFLAVAGVVLSPEAPNRDRAE